MKKLLSIILIVGLIFSLTGNVVAAKVNGEDSEPAKTMLKNDLGKSFVQSDLIEKVESDLDHLNSFLYTNDVSIKEIDKDSEFTYEVSFANGITNAVKVEEVELGSVQFDFTEGEKHNQVVVMKDGRIFLDGFEVITEDVIIENIDSAEQINVTSIQPFAAGFEWQFIPSLGIDVRSYTPISTLQGKQVSLGQTLQSMTKGALAGILSNRLYTALVGAAFVVDGWAAAFGAIMGVFFDNVADEFLYGSTYAAVRASETTYVSYFCHKLKPNNFNAVTPKYAYIFDFYAKADLQGPATKKTVLQSGFPR